MTISQSKPISSLVIGSSGAIGSAFTLALKNDPYFSNVVELNRKICPGFDLCSPESIEQVLNDSKFKGPFDLIVDATGSLTMGSIGPEKSLKALDGRAMEQSFWINCIGPALLMKMLVPRLSRQHCIYAKLSARVGSISDNKLGGWYSYRSSKAAFNMMLQTAAIEHHRVNQKAIFVALQPGTVASALSKPFVEASQALSAKDSVDQMLKAIYQLEPKSDAHFVDYKGETIYW